MVAQRQQHHFVRRLGHKVQFSVVAYMVFGIFMALVLPPIERHGHLVADNQRALRLKARMAQLQSAYLGDELSTIEYQAISRTRPFKSQFRPFFHLAQILLILKRRKILHPFFEHLELKRVGGDQRQRAAGIGIHGQSQFRFGFAKGKSFVQAVAQQRFMLIVQFPRHRLVQHIEPLIRFFNATREKKRTPAADPSNRSIHRAHAESI
ncbi:hypothetical protein GX408_06955 [bacterium]|nr:hypothetical protein [bacterium]